jgi:shikimate kinase
MVSIWRSLSEVCLTELKKERHFDSKMNQNDTKSQSLMFAMWFANNLHILAAFRLNGILASGQLNAKFATVICFVHCQLFSLQGMGTSFIAMCALPKCWPEKKNVRISQNSNQNNADNSCQI